MFQEYRVIDMTVRHNGRNRKLTSSTVSMKQRTVNTVKFKHVNPMSSEMLPSTRPHFLNLHKQCYQLRTKYSNSETYGTFLI